jgi:hypothetical protein
MVRPASGRRNSSSATEGLATHNLVCKMPGCAQIVQDVQNVQPLRSVQNVLNYLNGWNDLNGASLRRY